MKSQKGISPLIASVLLIAFTVSVAMIIMGWFSGFVRTTTENVSGVSAQAVGCSTGVVNMDSIYLKNLTNNATATIIVANEGRVSLDVIGMIVATNGTSCTNSTVTTVAAGSIGTLTIFNCPMLSTSTFSKAIITTSCSGVTDSTSKASDVVFS